MSLENHYDIICRDGNLGPLLAAAFLVKSGKRILLLPPSSSRRQPSFLLPLIAGVPRRHLLAGGLLTENTLCKRSNWSSWTDGQHVFNCSSVLAERIPALSAFMGDNFPWFQSHFAGFQNIWNIIDTIMDAGLMMPAIGLKDHWKIVKTLIKYQELLQNRRIKAENIYSDPTLPGWLKIFFTSMIPQISLFRYQSLPLVSFAYGIATMLQDAELVNLENLHNDAREFILANGGEASPVDYQVIFDGKWYIGVGAEEKAEIRSRAFITDSDRKNLEREIPPRHQRRDFFRQFSCCQQGKDIMRLRGHIAGMKKCPESCRWLFSDSNALSVVMSQGIMTSTGMDIEACYPADLPVNEPTDYIIKLLSSLPEFDFLSGSRIDFQSRELEKSWGYEPKLPPVMGGAFLPVSSTYKRFYHVGWENLPGFGFNGLVYAAKKAADRIIENEYQ